MSEALPKDRPFTPRVIEVEAPRDQDLPSWSPQVIVTERVEPVVPAERAPVAPRQPARKRNRVVSFGVAGVGVFLAGWLVVDAVSWISAGFQHGPVLGTLAALAVTAGVLGAGAVFVRELASLMRLKNVEAVRQRFSNPALSPAQARAAVAEVLAVLPREREVQTAVAAFQRQSQAHHGRAHQIQLLSRTVLQPLDRCAEVHVRTGVLRAFGITAISPTALTDAVFFLACGVRMVRGVADAYGHRPTAAATLHLLRRLLLDAGKLGALDLASASVMQHLGGAVTERFASTTAEALYAAYRMARLGIMVMDLCRPLAFQEGEAPSVGSLVAGVVRRSPPEPAPAVSDARGG
jgi:putative membrane protein